MLINVVYTKLFTGSDGGRSVRTGVAVFYPRAELDIRHVADFDRRVIAVNDNGLFEFVNRINLPRFLTRYSCDCASTKPTVELLFVFSSALVTSSIVTPNCFNFSGVTST